MTECGMSCGELNVHIVRTFPRSLLPQQFVILRVRPNPEPLHTIGHGSAQRTEMEPDSNATVSALIDQLELQRRMGGILFEQRVTATSKCLDLWRQRMKTPPKTARCEMLQISMAFPALYSASASAASAS